MKKDISDIIVTRQVYNGSGVVKSIAAILSVYQYFLEKKYLFKKIYKKRLSSKKF